MSIHFNAAVRRRSWHALLARVTDWALSNACLLCGGNAADTALCGSCSRLLPRSDRRACDGCAMPLPAGAAMRCGACLQAKLPYRRARAPLAYVDEVAWLLRRYKFQGDLAAGRVLAKAMAHDLEADGALREAPDLLVPVPLHRRRLQRRGFDQAVVLTRDLATRLGIRATLALERVRATKPQTDAEDVSSRRRNLRHAFVARRDRVSGRHVCIVDDVMTTGATVVEAAKAVRAAGAAEIEIWCCARTPRTR